MYIYIYIEGGGVGLRGLGKIGGGGSGGAGGAKITRKRENPLFGQTPKEPHPRKTPPLKRLTM